MGATRTWRRILIGPVLIGGTLFAGPCGITTLQAKDFLTSAAIRTTVTTLASVLEAATLDAAADAAANEETAQDGDG